MSFDFTTILGCSANDARLRALAEFFEEQPCPTERESELGDGYYLEFRRSGFSLLLTGSDIVETVHIYPIPSDEYHAFLEHLPFDLTANTTQARARELFGPPTHAGGPVRLLISMPVVYWDRWDYERHSCHLEYSEQRDSIRLITLSSISTPATDEPGNA